MFTRSDRPNVGLSVVAASVLTAAGGSMDAWVYMAHGHVFASAQTGNVVLFAAYVAAGDLTAAARHVLSIMAFILGLVSSLLAGAWLKKAGRNSRNVRLTIECVLLVALALIVSRLSNAAITACVGFIVAVQITSLSHIDDLTFSTTMTTGNIFGAFSAASAALQDRASKDLTRAIALGCICLAFAAGALVGGFFTLRFGDRTLFITAGTVGLATFLMWQAPDPIQSFPELQQVTPLLHDEPVTDVAGRSQAEREIRATSNI
jgi:uncharacterized membrane protein YoaK (UPF0700 family)